MGRPSPPSTSSAPERESLRPRLPAARSQPTCRRLRWWSRRPSTRSTSAHPPWRSPPPLPLPPGTSVLAPLPGRAPPTGGPAWPGLDPWPGNDSPNHGLPPLSATRPNTTGYFQLLLLVLVTIFTTSD